jgi:hypothetical protein
LTHFIWLYTGVNSNENSSLSSEPKLFHLADDIGEAKDLTATHPDKVKELKAAWDTWNAEQEEPRWRPANQGGRRRRAQ